MMLQKFPRNRAARQFATAASTGAWNDTFFGDTRRHGFLPSQKPVDKLPTEFSVLEQILQKMTCIQPDGTRSGLLAHNELGKTVDSDFPDLMHEIQKVDNSDQRMLAALFRDYSFLSSAYMLEPSHIHYLQTGNYGQANCTLPEKLAVPMQTIANKLNYGKPLLEYGYGYALGNWKLLNDPNPEELSYENKDILPPSGTKLKDHISNVRLFNGCTDEAGFIIVHVAIITQTNRQISSYDVMFDGAFKKNRELFNQGMQNHLVALRDMIELMRTMWTESNPKNYLNYRTFIMGIQGNDDIFPGGVLYKGVNTKRLSFRGETGAQDSTIPCVDSAFGVKYPRNSLTEEYLFELREYRPSTHQGLIDWCKQQNKASNMNEFALQDSYSSFLMLCNVHATFRFRRQHWDMVQKYIIDNTKYPRATGGTPITTWLPNQMGACLEMCHELIGAVKVEDLEAKDADEFKDIKNEIEEQTAKLMDEVNSYNKNEFAGVDQDLNELEKREKIGV